jgi:5-methylthioadenosine/S-adenosylhomocysteine deaminase
MSGNTLDIFSQTASASMTKDVVKMATIEGAAVLGMGDNVGSLEAGKCAGLVRINLDAPRLISIYDIYAALVFSAAASDVRDVMVNGAWILKNRESLTLEHAKIMADAAQTASDFKAKILQIDAIG